MMIAIPTPGNFTNASGVPSILRNINQWILWKPVIRGKKLVKIPVSYANPTGDNINAHEPLYWATFAEAVAAMQKDPRFGIGLVLDGTGIICLDYDDHAGDDAEAVKQGAEYMAHIRTQYPTYVERSIQGGGLHSFYAGTLPHGRTGGVIDQLNLEIYAAQFIAITGNAVGDKALDVANGQALIDSWRLPPPVASAGSIKETDALGRVTNLSDAQVIETMMVRRASIFAMMASTADLPDRSTSYAQIIGDLDKITGDPMQIDRIIRKCPFFKGNAYNSSKYDQQPRWLGRYQCATMLEYWLKQARADNTESIAYAEKITPARRAFLEKVGEAITYRTTVELPVELKMSLTQHAATERTISTEVQGKDPIARLLYLIEENVPGTYDKLTPPPGVALEFVRALSTMLTGARLTYMLPAVIASLAGYLGQTFKTPGFNMGLVTHFVIAGQMNTGKTSTMSVFNKAIDQALSGWQRNPSNPTKIMPSATEPLTHAKRRIVETRATSVQGLFDAISQIGSACWFADEAEAQMQTMSAGDARGDAMKAFYKQTFDKSGALDAATLDVSRESTKLGVVPILNLNLPTYFSCTSEVFETLREKELVDGTYSRVNMIYDERPMDANAVSPMTLHKGLPGRLMYLMQKIAFIADDTAAAYDQAGLKTLQREVMNPKGEKTADDLRQQIIKNQREGMRKVQDMEFTPAAEKLADRISEVCRLVGHDANPHVGKWPSHYQIMARSDMLPVLVAGVLASLDTVASWDVDLSAGNIKSDWRDSLPQVRIDAHHLQWAFEFVMYWRLSFFKAWDQGKIAVQMSSDEVVMERIIRRALGSQEAVKVENTWWVKQGYVARQATQVAPFKSAESAGRTGGRNAGTVMAKQAIISMVEHGTAIVAKGKDLGLSHLGTYVTLASY
jgi:hypothetical protein